MPSQAVSAVSRRRRGAGIALGGLSGVATCYPALQRCNVLSGGATSCPVVQRSVPVSCFSWRTWAGSPARRSCSTRGALKPRPSGLGFPGRCGCAAAPGTAAPGIVLRHTRLGQAAQRLAGPVPHCRYSLGRWTRLDLQPERPRQADPQQRHRRSAGDLPAASGSGGAVPGAGWLCAGAAAARHAGASRTGALPTASSFCGGNRVLWSSSAASAGSVAVREE